ncbi:MAG: ATP synthase F1 subunit delta [Bacteroidetes bacterium]|nr:ATP synthase F1 subunit delta [Bacteroidota bacterium]
MNHTKITIRYAKALFDLAQEQKVLEQVKDDMALISQVCLENRELRGMLHNPVINVEKKQKVLKSIFGSHINKLTSLFLDIISRKRRESYIDAIASDFVGLYKEYKGIKTAYVSSAVALDDTDRKTMTVILKSLTGHEIELIESIKTEIIGGFILSMDNYQVDQSLTAKVKRLKKDFDKNLYVKGF